MCFLRFDVVVGLLGEWMVPGREGVRAEVIVAEVMWAGDWGWDCLI